MQNVRDSLHAANSTSAQAHCDLLCRACAGSQFQGAGSGPAEGFTDFAAPAAPAPATTENGSAGLEDFFGGSGAIQSAGGSAALPPVTSLGATGVVADIEEEGVSLPDPTISPALP